MKPAVRARAVSVIAVAATAACAPQREEVARVNSPDDSAVALIVREDEGGAAGSRAYLIYIVSGRSKSDTARLVVEASHCDGIQVLWVSRNELSVRYQPACEILSFRNRWYNNDAGDDALAYSKNVEIVLDRESVSDATDY